MLQQSGEARDESFLVFRRSDVLVTINWALGDDPWVVINFVAEGRELSLKKLAKERGLSMPAPAEASVRGMLQRDAEVLRAWCTGRQP